MFERSFNEEDREHFIKSFSKSCELIFEDGSSVLDFSNDIQKNILGYCSNFSNSLYKNFTNSVCNFYNTDNQNQQFIDLNSFILNTKNLNSYFYKDFLNLDRDIDENKNKKPIFIYDKRKSCYEKIYKDNVKFLNKDEINFFNLNEVKYIILETSEDFTNLLSLLKKMKEKFEIKCFYEETFTGHYKNQKMFFHNKLMLQDLDGIISYNNFIFGVDHFCLYTKNDINRKNNIILNPFESFVYLNFLHFCKKNNDIKIIFPEKLNLLKNRLIELRKEIPTVISTVKLIDNSVHVQFNSFIEAFEILELSIKNGLKFSPSNIFENGISVNLNFNIEDIEILNMIDAFESILMQTIAINS